MAAQRTYLAIDLKSFYASVECVDRHLDPLTTNLVVADASRTEKTICLAVSPSLKAYKIPGRARLFEAVQRVREVNAQRLQTAIRQKKAVRGEDGKYHFASTSFDANALNADPALGLSYIVAPPRMQRYLDVSTQIYKTYLKYVSPADIYPYSIDEVFIDVTGYLPYYHMSAHELAMTMVREVLYNTGITATAGIGTNLYLAKLAMDIVAKHIPADKDGVRIAELDEQSYRYLLWNHRPLTDFWMTGPGTVKRLESHGIYTMGDLARFSIHGEDRLYEIFGVDAEILIDHAWGYEPCGMEQIKSYKPGTNSISEGQVLSTPYPYDLQEKNDFYYIVLSYRDADGKRKTKWEATGLSVKRNKKKAEALLLERRRNFMVPTAPAEIRLDDDILFSDFMLKWLEVTKSSIQITTYASYQGMVERIIAPYFRKRGIKLVDLKATDLQDFYTKQLERVKANSVIHYHANIHKALKYAVKIDLIPTNPADKVERPKKNEFKGSYYSAEEIHALTEIAEGTKLEIPVLLASFYGLRRSEVLGLKWDAIDFEENTLEIKHIVTQASIDGKKVLVQADRAKTKSSLRTLPLVPPIRDRLLMLKGQQDTYRRLCGKSYNRDYLGYLCVDEIGNIIRPNYVSEQFPKLLEKNGLRPIRFHDLRHSCASLLLANGVPMKQIQEWLGHSDFSTTANIYAHLDYASKLSSAQAMLERLGYGNASA